MTYTYDIATAVGQVRLGIPDTDLTDALFTDEEITYFLTAEDDDVDLAVARAFETIAGDNALLFRANIRSDDGQVTGSEGTKLLLQRAATLRANATMKALGFALSGGETRFYGSED